MIKVRALILFLLFFIQPAQAEEGKALIQKIDRMKSSVSQAEARQRLIYKQVLNSDIKIKKVSEERSKLNNKMLASEGDAQELAFEVREWEKKVRDQRSRIAHSVARIYQLKNPNILTFLFSDQRASEIEKNVRFLGKISERDFKLFKNYQVNLQKVKAARRELKKEVRHLLALREDLKLKENQLLDDQKSKSTLIQKIKSHKEKNLALLKKLRSQLPELDQDTRMAIFEKKGNLYPPLNRVPDQAYGSLFDPVYRVKLLHLGWTFENLHQSPVKAVFQGTVAFVGSLPGYGETLIIDHGNHYFSIYSHNSKLRVFQGEQIFTGQTVAISGPRLYFELRHFSNAIDPEKWISLKPHHEVAKVSAYGESL